MQQQMMQGDILNFDATMYDPTQSDGSLPVGTHKVIIERTEKKETKAGGSGMLVLHLKIVEGECQGMTGPYYLNLYNQDPQTREIASRQMSAVCHCVGVLKPQNSAQLFGIPFVIQVQKQKKNPDYTEVVKVLDVNGQPPRRGQTPAQTATQPQAMPQQQAPAAQPQAQQAAPQQAPWNNQQPAAQPAAQPAQAPQQAPWQAQPQQGQAVAAPPPQQAPQQASAPWNGGGAPVATPPWQQ